MSESDMFRQYAEEALAASSKTKDAAEKRDLSDLASMWIKAARVSEHLFAPPDGSTARH
jgi:hypothetical protein